MQIGGGLIERFDRLDARPHVIALHFRRQHQQHGGAGLEQLTIFGKTFREDDGFIGAGRIGQPENAHLVAGLGAAFLTRHHGAGDLAGGGAHLHGAGEFRPGLHAHLLEHRRIVVERMAGQEEADSVVFAAQPFRRQPGFDLRHGDRLRRTAAAKQFVLPDRRGFVGALRPAEHLIHGAEHAGAVRLELIERACGGKALQHALVDGARVHARGEIGQVPELGRSARFDDGLDRLTADAFERGQRVDDGVALDVESNARAVDRRRIDLDAETLGLGAEFRKFIRIAHIQSHRRRQELDRIIGLHVSGLIRDQRVSRGVALVEAVVGETFEQFENRVGLRLPDAARDAAIDEDAALLLHFAADLLAHGAAQKVGVAERIAGQNLGGLHHLLLIDDDAEGFLQHLLHLGMDVIRLLHAVLARAISRDVRHRARPVQRDQRDDILETVGPHVEQRAAHARAFQLEHADRFGARQQVIGLGVVERDGGEIDVDAAALQQRHRGLQHGQGLEAEEVELHQARLLDPFHIELGDRHVGFRIAIKRH